MICLDASKRRTQLGIEREVISACHSISIGFDLVPVGRPAFEKWSFVGYPLSSLVDGWSLSALNDAHQWLWGIHFAAFVAFLIILPTTKLRHMIKPMRKNISAAARRARSNMMSHKLLQGPVASYSL